MIRGIRRKIILLGSLFASALTAYSSPDSTVLLDFRSDGIGAELVLPLSELELAFGQPLTLSPEEVVSRFGPALGQYIQDHVRPVSPDGRKWQVKVDSLDLKAPKSSSDQPTELVARLDLRPPEGAPSRKLALHYGVIGRETFVMARSDWNSGLLIGQSPEPIGSIRAASAEGVLEIDRSNGDWWQGFASFVGLGLQSLAGKSDLLLFWVVLLLPVPLLISGGRWGGNASTGQTFWRLSKLVIAFTLGYSLTFLVTALTGNLWPQRAVEVLAALAIIVAAVHAVRPLFSRYELAAFAIFGLVYGLVLSVELPFSAEHFLPAIFAYNVGIEIMLLLVVLLFMPSLILLSGIKGYRHLRVAALLVSASWIALGFFPNYLKP